MEKFQISKAKTTEDHFPAWLENSIIIIIVMVIIHTIIDDLALAFNWPHKTQAMIIVLGFCFDLIFTIEFIGRSLISSGQKKFLHYIKHQRGWIDLLASVPLLLFVSGPALLVLLLDIDQAGTAFGFLSVLKTTKAIRVTRILRLIRVIKLFGKIQNTESVMTGRHIGTISTISVVCLILVLVLTEFVPILRFGNQEDYYNRRQKELMSLMATPDDINKPDKEWLIHYLGTNPNNVDIVKLLDLDGNPVYTNKAERELKWTQYKTPINIGGGYKVIISHFPADAVHSRVNLLILIGILFIIGAMMLVYTGVFARQIAEPIYIMDKGLRDMDYNLEVKLDAYNKNDEVFRLARAFNIRWLPLKNQINNFRKSRQKEKSVISVDDIL